MTAPATKYTLGGTVTILGDRHQLDASLELEKEGGSLVWVLRGKIEGPRVSKTLALTKLAFKGYDRPPRNIATRKLTDKIIYRESLKRSDVAGGVNKLTWRG